MPNVPQHTLDLLFAALNQTQQRVELLDTKISELFKHAFASRDNLGAHSDRLASLERATFSVPGKSKRKTRRSANARKR